MSSYEIVFSGQLQAGFDAQQVRANLCQLFKTDAARIERLFSAHSTVLKKGLDQASAEKYRAALQRAGALVEVINTEAAAPELTRHNNAAITARDNYMAAFSHIDAPDFAIAAPGSPMQDKPKEWVPVDVDLSQLSLAPVGSDMAQLKDETVATVPDISHLALQ
ncbi:hypothetical protein AXE65_09470 [Ventosimonas gracilis]|uniref:Ribosomal protein L7/L12 C-terminal domain-containing protein n=1 Tax=Ventosimonas gracilis TaxID=1680762 RepID=A0A139SY34_9GAMM|nr:hypothetical protein [Ventosimonas gracilis]KXU39292.1 hypothetical protein AXE65_09470 [Ventosimonas gracilis]